MIKVAVIIERADIALGGAERSIFELTGRLKHMGVDVTLLAAKGQAQAGNAIVLCEGLKGKRTSLASFGNTIKQHLAENHYDIVHSTLPFAFADIYQPRGGSYPEAMIRNAASYDNRAIQCYKRITHFSNFRRTSLLLAERKLCSPYSKTIVAALSEYVKDQYIKHYSLSANRIVVIPNGVKTDRNIDVKAADKLRGHILTSCNITEADRPIMFLFAANNFRLKGLKPLIHALSVAKNKKTERPLYLVVAGSGSSRKYRKLADKLDVADRIIFLGPLHAIQKALSITDVAILPSYYDPCSRFILEAIASQKPVITTLFNGASEAYTDFRHGKIIDDPRNVDELAKAMVYYSTQKHLDESIEAIAEDDLKKQVSIERHTRQIVELYEKINAMKRKA